MHTEGRFPRPSSERFAHAHTICCARRDRAATTAAAAGASLAQPIASRDHTSAPAGTPASLVGAGGQEGTMYVRWYFCHRDNSIELI